MGKTSPQTKLKFSNIPARRLTHPLKVIRSHEKVKGAERSRHAVKWRNRSFKFFVYHRTQLPAWARRLLLGRASVKHHFFRVRSALPGLQCQRPRRPGAGKALRGFIIMFFFRMMAVFFSLSLLLEVIRAVRTPPFALEVNRGGNSSRAGPNISGQCLTATQLLLPLPTPSCRLSRSTV